MLWLLPMLPLIAAAALAVRRPTGRIALAQAAGAALGGTLVLALLAAAGGWSGSLAWGPVLRLQLTLVPLAVTAAILVPAVALPITLYAAAHESRDGLVRLIALLLAFVGAMELLVVASDLLTLLVGWELAGACSWALIGHHWHARENAAAGRYAFVLTRVGDMGLFVAAMAAFASTGSFAYAALEQIDGPLLGVLVAGVLVSAAAKSAQVPFAPWLFRAMAGPTSVSALLHAAAMVAAGAFLLARLQPVLAGAAWFAPATMAIGLTTALAGGVVAALQSDAKKLLAASTSAQFGLMFVAVGAGYPAVAVIHLAAHAFLKGLLFLTTGIIGERRGSFALAGTAYGRALPWIAGANAAGALALAGVPPLGGAWTKETVAAAAGHAAPMLAVGVMAAGALSALYAARHQFLLWGPRGEGAAAGRAPHGLEYGGIGALAVVTLALGLLWLPDIEHAAAAALGAELPQPRPWETALSLTLVAVGLYAGWLRAYPTPEPGEGAAAAEWLGLPRAIEAGLARPCVTLARGAAWLDDRAVDALPRGAATLGRGMAGLGARFGELLADGLVRGLASVVGAAGADLRRLQTGMAQHYYAGVAVGVAVLTFILLVGGA